MKTSIRHKIGFIKNHAEFHVFDEEGGVLARLVPVNRKSLKDFECVASRMSDWRNLYADCFLTRFHATSERTEHWLNHSLIPQEDKLLFFIIVGNDIVGHIGLADITGESAEIDNVINNHRERNFFANVLKTVMALVFELMDIERLQIRYLSNNVRAVRAYQKIFGTTVIRIDHLKYEEKNGEGCFTVCSQGESNTDVRYLTSAVVRQEYDTSICFPHPLINRCGSTLNDERTLTDANQIAQTAPLPQLATKDLAGD